MALRAMRELGTRAKRPPVTCGLGLGKALFPHLEMRKLEKL